MEAVAQRQRDRRTGFVVGESVSETIDTAVPSHTNGASSWLWAESSHHRLTHRIAGPFVQQPRLNGAFVGRVTLGGA